jgi:hypothetical protein
MTIKFKKHKEEKMWSRKRKIYSVTLDSILKDIKLPSSNRLRKAIKNSTNRKLIYHQGDKLDDIWEALKISSKYWLNFDLADAFAEFIRQLEPITAVCHLTFKNHIRLKQVYQYFHKFVRELSEKYVCKRYRRKKIPGVAWVLVIEMQRRGEFCIHLLLDHPRLEKVPLSEMKKVWWDCGPMVAKNSKFERYNSDDKMRFYLANHIHRDAIIEFAKPICWENRSQRGLSNLLCKTHT